jgi:hypothetical protein
MKGQIRFQYSCVNDVVTAYVDWHLQTPEDLEIWAAQYDSYFKGRFPNKVDLILELTKFRLSPRLAPRFREVRNRILFAYTNRSYRVNEPTMERAMMYAGSVLNGGPANQFGSIDEALAALCDRTDTREILGAVVLEHELEQSVVEGLAFRLLAHHDALVSLYESQRVSQAYDVSREQMLVGDDWAKLVVASDVGGGEDRDDAGRGPRG